VTADDERRLRLRATFEEVPELYDRARPSYPEALVDELVELAGLRAGSRVLEAGCGTGKLTAQLAARRVEILCVELGAGLAAIARRNLAPFPAVEVVTADFDEWDAAGERFDAVVAATAWHWLDPATKHARVAELVVPGGALAVVGTLHVLPEDGDEFFREIQPAYGAIGEEDDPPPHPDEVRDVFGDELRATGLFEEIHARRHVWSREYDAEGYVAVLDTYSGHRELAPAAREQLYAAVRRGIAARGGRVRKHYLTTLSVARLPAPAK
jgi:SAM-dependent methyltransferase